MSRCDVCNSKLTFIAAYEGQWVGRYKCPTCESLYEITNLGQGSDITKIMIKRGPNVSIVEDPRYKNPSSTPPHRLKVVYIPTFREKFRYYLKKLLKKFGR